MAENMVMTQEKHVKKQGVELYRFIMTIIICLHHFRLYSETMLPYGGGYLAVDFFFMLSGFFLHKHSQKYSVNNTVDALKKTVEYTRSRYRRLYPQYVLILTFSILTYAYVMEIRIDTSQVGALISKFLMIDGIYVHTQLNIMPQGWYCSGLLFSSALVYFLSIRYRQKFAKEWAPILAIGIYAIFFFQYGYLNLYTQYGFGITVGCFRGIAGLCAGCVLSSIIEEKRESHTKPKWLSILLLGILTGIILYALLWKIGYSRNDFGILIIFAITLYCLLGDDNIRDSFNKRIFGKLGEISYTMFLAHHLTAVLFDYFDWFRAYDWKIASLMYLCLVFICSVFFTLIMTASKAIMKSVNFSGKKPTKRKDILHL